MGSERVACRICDEPFADRGDAANHLEDAHNVITNAVETRLDVVADADAPEVDPA